MRAAKFYEQECSTINPIISYKDISIDLVAREVRRAERSICLTPQEFSLLVTLVTHCNTALSRSQLMEEAWGYTYIGESRTVDVHINHLRHKLGLEGNIQTVYRVGYRLNSVE